MHSMMERRNVLKQLLGLTVMAFGSGPLFTSCGSSSPAASGGAPNPGPSPQGGEAAGACVTNGTTTEVEGDALHMLTVPKEDVAAGVEKSYHIQGQENHDHIVTLTAEDFATLRQGKSLRLQSGPSIGPVASHFHFVDVSCAAST